MMYGKILARAVDIVLGGVRWRLWMVRSGLRMRVIQVPFQKPPSKAALQARLAQATTAGKRRQIQYLLDTLERDGKLPEQHPYPYRCGRFGSGLPFYCTHGRIRR